MRTRGDGRPKIPRATREIRTLDTYLWAQVCSLVIIHTIMIVHDTIDVRMRLMLWPLVMYNYIDNTYNNA